MKKWFSIALVVLSSLAFAGPVLADVSATVFPSTATTYVGASTTLVYTVTNSGPNPIPSLSLSPLPQAAISVQTAGGTCTTTPVAVNGHCTLIAKVIGEKSTVSPVTLRGYIVTSSDERVLAPTVAITVKVPTLTSVTVSPATTSVQAGNTTALTATANYTGGTTKNVTSTATWSSSSNSTATVSGGVVTGVASGKATISAAFSGQSGSSAVTVTPANLKSVTVTPAQATVSPGKTQSFTVSSVTLSDGQTISSGYTVSWSCPGYSCSASGNSTTVTVPSSAAPASTGIVTATVTSSTYAGQAQANATVTVGQAGLGSVTITPASQTVNPGGKTAQPFVATVTDMNGKTIPSSDYTIGWTAPSGYTFSDASSGSTTVTAPNSAAPDSNATITASVTSTQYTGSPQGTATVTVSDEPKSIAISVVNGQSTIPQGGQLQLKAIVTWISGKTEDMTNSVLWSSSGNGLTVSQNGVVSSAPTQKVGTTGTISAELSAANLKSNTLNLTVGNPVPVSLVITTPQGAQQQGINGFVPGVQLQLAAKEMFSNGTAVPLPAGVPVVWSTSNSAVATFVNQTGLLSTVKNATAWIGLPLTITARAFPNGVPLMGNTTLTSSPLVNVTPSLMFVKTASNGTVSYTGTLTVKNVGKYPLTNLSGTSSASGITSGATTCETQIPLQPNATCSFTFTAQTLPIDTSAVITISSTSDYNDGGPVLASIPVSALSVTPFSPPVNPTNNASLMLVQGCTATPQNLLITNLSSVPVSNITATAGAGLGKPVFGYGTCSGAILATGEVCGMNVLPDNTSVKGASDLITVTGTGVTIPASFIAAMEAGNASLPAPGTVVQSTGDLPGNTVFTTIPACNIVKVSANKDQSSGIPWDASLYRPIFINATSTKDGQSNSILALRTINYTEGEPNSAYAAGLCFTLTENNAAIWYLPAQKELLAWVWRSGGDGLYWSSTESSLDISVTNIGNRPKDTDLSVRCIRSLTY